MGSRKMTISYGYFAIRESTGVAEAPVKTMIQDNMLIVSRLVARYESLFTENRESYDL